MNQIVFRYCSRELDVKSITFIRGTIAEHYAKGRSHVSWVLCKTWGWVQPNGKPKEYAARDLLLRLKENGFVRLPPRLRPKNNLKCKSLIRIVCSGKASTWAIISSGLQGLNDHGR